jgi:hypothetical protein
VDTGSVPVPAREIFNGTVVPGAPDAEERLSVAFCAKPQMHAAAISAKILATRDSSGAWESIL